MNLVKPSFEILEIMGMDYGDPLKLIENAGRTCYKSEDKITLDSAEKFTTKIITSGHHSVLEHSAITIKIICDRGVTHEIVRHRLAAYSQESTRYCNYKGGVTFIIPPWVSIEPGEYFDHKKSSDQTKGDAETCWFNTMLLLEESYKSLLRVDKWSPQQARSVLPNSLKTEIVVTTNIREWRHILKLRTSNAAHPQMQEIMIPILKKFQELMPTLFNDIGGTK